MTAMIALIGLGIFYGLSGGVQDLWGTANSAIAAANTSTAAAAVQGSSPIGH